MHQVGIKRYDYLLKLSHNKPSHEDWYFIAVCLLQSREGRVLIFMAEKPWSLESSISIIVPSSGKYYLHIHN